MDAIVAAGGTTDPDDPLYPFAHGKPKSLLDICGKPMVQWVLDALTEAKQVERIVMIGIGSENDLKSPKIVGYVPEQGGLLQNVRAGMRKVKELNPAATHVLSVSSDIPAITAEMVDWTVAVCSQTDDDVYYNVISRQVMEKRYPSSKRTYVKLKDVEVCGGDMNVLRVDVGSGNDEFWEQLIAARKNAFRQAALVGFDTLFLLLFHLVTLDEAARLLSRRLHFKGRAILCPYAEIGMDVDKPFQLDMVREDLCPHGVA